ncbi:hypothetical protein WP50_31795 [Lactiplantibacillus plantarum]|nr:hypothetical protein WP50_31775 [Lactiplantibacillus plantarum]KLD57697.1 hypothetical protein WP50_31780 [Lactiplantibacillus plantarum]KLD57698.1 hypothetical protein WP50_31785 [Lactiplantibacillus plantarum]KLD57699.1 hypothetical protein WP50_31790 [Lactiplantibacillus plantarum]KLD57700.1 hypothetical protein WP50_31795 [Lactiplantibacillus plantarum]
MLPPSRPNGAASTTSTWAPLSAAKRAAEAPAPPKPKTIGRSSGCCHLHGQMVPHQLLVRGHHYQQQNEPLKHRHHQSLKR